VSGPIFHKKPEQNPIFPCRNIWDLTPEVKRRINDLFEGIFSLFGTRRSSFQREKRAERHGRFRSLEKGSSCGRPHGLYPTVSLRAMTAKGLPSSSVWIERYSPPARSRRPLAARSNSAICRWKSPAASRSASRRSARSRSACSRSASVAYVRSGARAMVIVASATAQHTSPPTRPSSGRQRMLLDRLWVQCVRGAERSSAPPAGTKLQSAEHLENGCDWPVKHSPEAYGLLRTT